MPDAPLYFPNRAIKLCRLPIFGPFSILISKKLFFFPSELGREWLSTGGEGDLTPEFASFPSPALDSGGLDVRRPRVRMVLNRELSVRLCSLDVFRRFSISLSTVIPLVARYSSAMPTNRTTPRSAGTPRTSIMKFWMRAAFRLFVVG